MLRNDLRKNYLEIYLIKCRIMLSEGITYTCTTIHINRPTPFAVTTTARLRPRVAD